jgi:MFS family permease
VNYFEDPAPASYRRWAIFFVGSINFVLSMFARVSTTVISGALSQDLELTSSHLADISAAFYYSFALSQLPLGFALNRFGPRASAAILAATALGGAVLFAQANSYLELVVARVMLGIGMSGNLMVLLALFGVWFPANRFAFLSGTVVSVGVLGNLLAATPLAILSQEMGWRGSFWIFAAVEAFIGTLFVVVARSSPKSPAVKRHQQTHASLKDFLYFITTYSYWAVSYSSFVRYGFFAALQGLWIAPYLSLGLGMGEIEAANGLLSMGLGYMVSLPISGFLSDRVVRSRKKVVLPALAGFSLMCLAIGFFGKPSSFWFMAVCLFFLGFFAAPGQIMYAHIKELVPGRLTSQAMTAVNLFTVLGAAAMTQVIGLVLPSHPGEIASPSDFTGMWLVGALSLGAACLFYLRVPESAVFKST